ncbi:MAG: hypothetical protein ACJ8FY_12565 [Gemmataceae bacterium]
MQRLAQGALAAFLGLLLMAAPSPALKRVMPAAPSIPSRVAMAETIILGKVTRIEGQSVMVAETPGSKDKKEYFVAIVHVEESLKGADGLTDVKVGFPAQETGGFLTRGEGFVCHVLQLCEDQEVGLFLKPHSSGEFLVAAGYYASIEKKNPDFEKSWQRAKQCTKLLADPLKGLQSSDREERFLCAALLILQYRNQQTTTNGQPKEQPIDAKESQLILQALAEANWEKPGEDLGHDMRPDSLFARLNLTQKDGWNQQITADAAKNWLKENAAKYRVKKLLADSH